jgi:hypothetical protein
MITDQELSTARKIRTQCGWFEFYNIAPETVTIVGDFLDYRVPRTMILEVK